MFMNAMSDIVVKRFNVHKTPQDQIKTRLVYAPKQRVLNDLLDKDQNIQLPAMAVSIGGITRDESRVFNKILGMFNANSTNTSFTNEKMPIPVNLTLNVSLMTKFQTDMDQLLTHLLPYINPYFVVSWRTPGRPDHEIRSNIFWEGNVNLQYPIDITSTQIARVVADLTFTFKGWLFQAIPDETFGSILTINSDYVNVGPNALEPFLLSETARPSSSNEVLDSLFYDGSIPRPQVIVPYTTEVGTNQEFAVYGPGFTKINNVYLSGAPLSSISSFYDPFSAVPTLSADFPGITAVKIDSKYWTYNKNNLVTFTMPSANIPGTLELIIEGPVGYGKLTESVKIGTFNPYVSGTPEYENFVPFQLPYLSGIKIVNL
jgi:hypothetical protein